VVAEDSQVLNLVKFVLPSLYPCSNWARDFQVPKKGRKLNEKFREFGNGQDDSTLCFCCRHFACELFDSRKVNSMNPNISYYNTKKYCPSCQGYVRFLQSLDASYCVDCGSKVRLFSSSDKKEFLEGLKAAKQGPRRMGKDQKRVS